MLRKAALISSLAFVASSVFATADAKAATSGYALGKDGKKLMVMQSLKSGEVTAMVKLSKSVDAIAYRPVTGDLLGFSNGGVFKIDTQTGSMTDLGATFTEGTDIAKEAAVAFDFNNKIDAVRAVSSNGDNLVYFPIGFGDNDERASSVRRFTSIAYAEGDKLEGKKAKIFANAYTNAIKGEKASSTFQYALDAKNDTLVSLANNKGTLSTVAKVTVDGKPVDLAAKGGFDIVSSKEDDNRAYAILQMEGAKSAGLYKINLETGAAELLKDLGVADITGFAAG